MIISSKLSLAKTRPVKEWFQDCCKFIIVIMISVIIVFFRLPPEFFPVLETVAVFSTQI